MDSKREAVSAGVSARGATAGPMAGAGEGTRFGAGRGPAGRRPATVAAHTRGSILQRLLTHEAWHCGELSQTLGINRLPQIDLWRAD